MDATHMPHAPRRRFVEEVECAECGHRYDSEQQTFCPRCGNDATRRGVTAESFRPQRFDPRHKRAKMAGLMLIALGVVSLIAFGAVAAFAHTFSLADSVEVLGAQPGGDVVLTFTDGGVPVANANVTLAWDTGNLTGMTDTEGRYNGTVERADATLTIEHNGTWIRDIIALEGMPLELTIDTADPQTSDEVVTPPVPVNSIRGLAGFFAFASLFVIIGGVAAFRLKGRSLAIGGAVAGLLPVLILVTAVPNVASVILMVVLTVALLFILQARTLFR